MKDNNFLSVAIPTYYSSAHITECLKSFKNIPQINEIVINDDGSSDKEYKNLNLKVDKINHKFKFDIKISRNKNNLGGFKNKYLTVSKCKNNTIYQLDSDNFIDDHSKNFLKNYTHNEPEDNLILPGKVNTVFENKVFFISKKSFNNITVSSEDIVINLSTAKKLLSKDKASSVPEDNNLAFKWLLNLGNPIFDKNTYIKKLEEGYNSKELPLEACSIAMTFFWFKNGGRIKILKEMLHNQRIHKNSYYIREGENAKNSVDFFHNQIMELT